MRLCCSRCDGVLHRHRLARANARTAAIALSALILYPLAIGLPMITVSRFGHQNEASIVTGIVELFERGHLLIGVIVLLCSLVIPLMKLAGLLILSTGGLGLQRRHRALTYRLIEWTGRWGMLDIFLVAVLVAALKLGDLVEVTPGPAAIAFALVVLLSLFAAAAFDPHRLWESDS